MQKGLKGLCRLCFPVLDLLKAFAKKLYADKKEPDQASGRILESLDIQGFSALAELGSTTGSLQAVL